MVLTSMILILLVLTSVGIVWVVVQTAIDDNTDIIEIQSNCLGIDLKLSSIICPTPAAGNYLCNFSILRKTGGGDFDGFKMVFSNEDGTVTTVHDFLNAIKKLETFSRTDYDSQLPLADGRDTTKVKITPYFITSTNEKILC